MAIEPKEWAEGDLYPAARMTDLEAEVAAKAAQGDPGQDGTDGQDGADGATPTIGENGNWHVNGQDTGTPARGPAGEDGADGQDGADGSDADNPFTEDEVTALKALVADGGGE